VSARLAGWLVFVGLFAALAYYGNFAVGDGGKKGEPLYDYATAIGGLVQYLVILAILLLIGIGTSKRELFALHRPRSWPRALMIGGGVFIGVFALAAALDPILHPGKEQGLVPDRWESQHAGAFVANFLVVVLAAPIVEELTFRGAGFTLLERYGRPLAIVAVGLLFGLAHGLVDALPLLAAFGMGLAYLRARTASVYPGMLLHALFNGVTLIVAVST